MINLSLYTFTTSRARVAAGRRRQDCRLQYRQLKTGLLQLAAYRHVGLELRQVTARAEHTCTRCRLLRIRRHDHITPALIELHWHWLPIKHRVTFKLATITFKVMKTERPEYLRALLNDYKPSRELRSSCRHDPCLLYTSDAA